MTLFLINTLGYYLLVGGGMFLLNTATAVAGFLGLAWMVWIYQRDGLLTAGAQTWLLARVALAALAAGMLGRAAAGWLGPASDLAASLLPLAGGALAASLAYFGLARLLRLPLRLR